MFPQNPAPAQNAPRSDMGQVIRLVHSQPAPQRRKRAALCAKDIENAKPREKLYRLYDTEGLYLEVTPGGGLYWRLKYYVHGKERRLALGTFPEITLAEAREKRLEARKLLANGVDPFLAKRDQKRLAALNSATTFELVAREWHNVNKPKWTESYGKTFCIGSKWIYSPKSGAIR